MCRVCLRIEQPTWPALPPDPPVEFAREEHFSNLHLSVSDTLTSLGFVHSHEVNLGGLTVDMQLEDGRVIEVDGKYHFDRSRQYRGHTLFKQRLLRGMGYEVFSINCHEWNRSTTGQRLEYLSKLLSPKASSLLPPQGETKRIPA